MRRTLAPAAMRATAQTEPGACECTRKQDALGARLALKLYDAGKQMEKLGDIFSRYLQ